ncbi:MAG: hypothetical protein GVY26_13395, partial [Bacteroidetes bacterium]|nr:hypothetical protein [Bacteroidota bacterium]
MYKRDVMALLAGVLLLLAACQDDVDEPEGRQGSLDQELTVLLEDLSPNSNLSYFRFPESNDFIRIPQDP